MVAPDIIQRSVQQNDVTAIRRLCASTGFFNEAELDIAAELAQAAAVNGTASGYHFLFAEMAGELVGYSCYGFIEGTHSSWDLYWIVVESEMQGRGSGRALIKATHEAIKANGGTRVYAETSSRALYAPTRAFYERMGYHAEAALSDFYGPGDAKIIYTKIL